MARDEFIERLRSYNQIEDVMSSYVSLKRAGINAAKDQLSSAFHDN